MRRRASILVAAVALLVASALPARGATINFTPVSTSYDDWFWGFAVDPVTGNYYAKQQMGAFPLRRYTSWNAFVNNTPDGTAMLAGENAMAYFAVNNGDVFARRGPARGRRWNATTGAVEVGDTPFDGMGFDGFDWSGPDDTVFMQDISGIYVFGRTSLDWQLRRLDANLNTLNQISYPNLNLGYAFVINGFLFTAPTYTQPSVLHQVNAATGAVTSVNHTLSGLGGPSLFLSNFSYDWATDRLFAFNTTAGNFGSRLYVAENASVQFGVPLPLQEAEVPEPGSLILLGTGVFVIAVQLRRRAGGISRRSPPAR